MELTPEIEKIFASAAGQIVQLELTYRNGGQVTGSIRKLRLSPLRLVVLKSEPGKGERSRHRVVFDHVTQMKVRFQDGSQKVFPA